MHVDPRLSRRDFRYGNGHWLVEIETEKLQRACEAQAALWQADAGLRKIRRESGFCAYTAG